MTCNKQEAVNCMQFTTPTCMLSTCMVNNVDSSKHYQHLSVYAISSLPYIYKTLNRNSLYSTFMYTVTVPFNPAGVSTCPSSIIFSLSISCLYSRSKASFGSSLMRGLFLMFFALFAYLSVLQGHRTSSTGNRYSSATQLLISLACASVYT